MGKCLESASNQAFSFPRNLTKSKTMTIPSLDPRDVHSAILSILLLWNARLLQTVQLFNFATVTVLQCYTMALLVDSSLLKYHQSSTNSGGEQLRKLISFNLILAIIGALRSFQLLTWPQCAPTSVTSSLTWN